MTMTKRERVLAAVSGETPDRVPACFSLHFPRVEAFGEEAVQAHLRFYRETGVDILKAMNENLVPLMGAYTGPADWKKVPRYDRTAPFIRDQLELLKRLRDAEPDAYLLATVHGACASQIHTLEANYGYEPVRQLFADTMREEPGPMLEARDRITDALCELTNQIMAVGCDGVYYAALGGESRYYSDEEFDRAVRPYDHRVLSAIREAGGQVFLHICKDRLAMNRYRDYGPLADVVNWGVYEAPLSLEEGRALFPGKTIMGGLANRGGVLTEGTEEELAAEVRRLTAENGPARFILGADCTLPTDTDPQRIRAAVLACG